ncbi:hypothetical protein VTN31DRAFT_5909 [Thermomyces dupontii]|uniref:uncharacterized protein n=1 Tax=Talaromyces thermophilus TaxID=28565 RepID=UPI003743376C
MPQVFNSDKEILDAAKRIPFPPPPPPSCMLPRDCTHRRPLRNIGPGRTRSQTDRQIAHGGLARNRAAVVTARSIWRRVLKLPLGFVGLRPSPQLRSVFHRSGLLWKV